MMTGAKQNKAASTWKPFATSTPMRIVPDKTKTDGLPQTQLTKGKDSKGLLKKTLKTLNNGQGKHISVKNGQAAKKLKRNRSTFYFDASSSSSSEDNDSCLSSNGPTIKINLEGNTNMKSSFKNGDVNKKILLSSENSINKSNEFVMENVVSVKSANKKKSCENNSINKEIRVRDKAVESGKLNNELISPPQDLDSKVKHSFRNKSSSYNHEENNRDNSLKKKKIISQDEGNNSSNNSKDPKCENGDLNGCESNGVATTEFGKSSEQQNDDLKNQNFKRKRTKPMNDALNDSEGKIEKKRFKNAKELTPVDESPTNQKNFKLKVKGSRKDSSHQLFSDSMHQELINSLDLTTYELDSDQEQIFNSPWKLTPQKTLPKRTRPKGKVVRNIYNNDISEMEKPKRSMRQRQQPKEFWMPRNQCDLNKITDVSNEKPESEELLIGNMKQDKTSHVVFELDNEPTKKNSNQGNSKKSLNIKSIGKKEVAVIASQHPYIELQKEKDHVLKNAVEVKTQKLGLSQKIAHKTNNAKKSDKDVNEDQGESNKENRMSMDGVNVNSLPTNFTDVFKQLNQLPTFENCLDGVQTAECWSLKNFKCGVLKVKNQCQISNKTKFENSYFGGILIKGSLKMKIGSKDLKLYQGDMAFVPPLTEWRVIGTHESESSFYYWCGRFKN